MDISDWRKKIDELDGKLAALLNERAAAAVEIGKLKRNTRILLTIVGSPLDFSY